MRCPNSKSLDYLTEQVNEKAWKHLKSVHLTVVEENRSKILKTSFTVKDVKYKNDHLLAPNGKGIFVFKWKGKYSYTIPNDTDWNNAPSSSFGDKTTILELKKRFVELINSGCLYPTIDKVMLYFR